MGTTLDSLAIAGNRMGQPNYPKEFKQQTAVAACEPGISVAKLAMAHQLNVNMVFRSRRELRAWEAEPMQASPTLLPIVLERPAAVPRLKVTAAAISAPTGIDEVIGNASVRVSGTPDEALLRAAFRSLRP